MLYAFDEAIDLPEACGEKLAGSSSKKLKAIQSKAKKSVLNLAETKKLAAYIQTNADDFIRNSKIVYSSNFVVQKLTNKQQCFSEISVYTDNGAILHSWNVFLVDLKGVAQFVMYLPDSEYITLKEWRKKRGLDGQYPLH